MLDFLNFEDRCCIHLHRSTSIEMAEAYMELMETMKPKSKTPRSMYNADVTNLELRATKLTAEQCRQLNREALERNRRDLTTSEPQQPPGGATNSDFMIMVDKYDKNYFNMEPLRREPQSCCPDRERHFQLHYNRLVHLAVACPTCWSLQRNNTCIKDGI